MAEKESTLETDKVSLKFPSFWPEKPEIWFYQIDAQFSIHKITNDTTKFNHLIAQIDPKLVENLWDIICDDTITNKYTRSKERLLTIFKDSENKRMKTLLTGIELGDLKPSQLLRRMQSLAGSDISNSALKTLWLDKLPDTIKNVLIVSDEDIQKLSVMADKIVDISPSNVINAVNKDSENSNAILLQKIASLENQIFAMSSFMRRTRSASRESNRSSKSNGSSKQFNPKGKYCFYHFRFGKKMQN
ncbi:hypothetical protein ACJJTC_018233 [Scirpophaga incertulas]